MIVARGGSTANQETRCVVMVLGLFIGVANRVCHFVLRAYVHRQLTTADLVREVVRVRSRAFRRLMQNCPRLQVCHVSVAEGGWACFRYR